MSTKFNLDVFETGDTVCLDLTELLEDIPPADTESEIEATLDDKYTLTLDLRSFWKETEAMHNEECKFAKWIAEDFVGPRPECECDELDEEEDDEEEESEEDDE